MTTSTDPRVRLTISVSPEVHATFQRMAAAGSMSVSRAMGDWLADTIEAAEYATSMMEKARAAPREVAREMHAYALGLADETGALITKLRAKSAARAAAGASAPGVGRAAPGTPRPVIRGGKSPISEKQKGQGGKP